MIIELSRTEKMKYKNEEGKITYLLRGFDKNTAEIWVRKIRQQSILGLSFVNDYLDIS